MFVPALRQNLERLVLIAVLCLPCTSRAQISESFDGWSDISYGAESTYVHAGVGTWVSLNALTENAAARTGKAVRFHNDSPAPWLEFRGLDENGIDGGVGAVSFYYRHWNGNGNTISFVLQYNEDGAGWVDAGLGATVTTETTYQLFSRTINSSSDNVKLRIFSTANDERLVIDDFEVSATAATPQVGFQSTATTAAETDGVVFLPVEIIPAAAATVDVVRVGGDATEGADFTFAPTTLVFSTSVSSHNVPVLLIDDTDIETYETVLFAITNVAGAAVDPGGATFDLTITDDDQTAIEFDGPGTDAPESAGIVQVSLSISKATNASVEVQFAGTATPNVDYTVIGSTTIVFNAAGPTTQVVSLSIIDDVVEEPPETIDLVLTNPSGAIVGAEGVFTLEIDDNDSMVIKIMAANTTSGTLQSYEDPGIRIFQALNPDIVGIQEFNTTDPGGLRGFVDEAFGTNFHYMVEGGSESIPNGIISRWPIIASGEWIDDEVANRDFAWATIDIPGDTNLHVVSVHLLSSSSSSRQSEATNLVARITATFPPNDYIVLCGDLNVGSRTESAVITLGAILSDSHQPEDQFGDDDTNEPRSKPYDYVLPNAALNARHLSLTVGGIAFADGIVFDTRTNLWGATPPSPALSSDSGASGMQHMVVMKAFLLPVPDPVTLTVTSPHGSPVPPAGVSTLEFASVLSPSVPDPIVTLSSTQFVLTGWTGSGSVPASGSASAIPSFSVTNDSTLTWDWATNYWLQTSATSGGGVTPTSGWVEAESVVGVQAQPESYYLFELWTGDVPAGEETNSAFALSMTGPRSLTATFAADTASMGTPHWWLALYGWTNNFDAAEILDVDLDGMQEWAEFVAGTDPLLGTSLFVITDAVPGSSVEITVPTQPGRRYSIEYSNDYGSGAPVIQWFPFANPAAGVFDETGESPAIHTFVDDFGPDTTAAPPPAGTRAYRVRVAYP